MPVPSKIALPIAIPSDGSSRGLDAYNDPAWSSPVPNLDNSHASLCIASSNIGSASASTSAPTSAPDSLVSAVEGNARLSREYAALRIECAELRGRAISLEYVLCFGCITFSLFTTFPGMFPLFSRVFASNLMLLEPTSMPSNDRFRQDRRQVLLWNSQMSLSDSERLLLYSGPYKGMLHRWTMVGFSPSTSRIATDTGVTAADANSH